MPALLEKVDFLEKSKCSFKGTNVCIGEQVWRYRHQRRDEERKKRKVILAVAPRISRSWRMDEFQADP